jgi:hypothetical protein
MRGIKRISRKSTFKLNTFIKALLYIKLALFNQISTLEKRRFDLINIKSNLIQTQHRKGLGSND